MAYNVALLIGDDTDLAEAHNAPILGPMTKGIEVTVPALAARCGLGNHDHHKHGEHQSSIQMSMHVELPPDGAILATIKPDKDSFGTKAVFQIRLEGSESSIDLKMVEWIGLVDRYGVHGAARLRPDLRYIFRRSSHINAMDTIVHQNPERLGPGDRIYLVSNILTHEMHPEELDYWASLKRKPPCFNFDSVAEYYQPLPILFVETREKLGIARSWANDRAPIAIIHEMGREAWNVVWSPLIQFDSERFAARMIQAEALARNMSIQEVVSSGYAGGVTDTMWITPAGRGRKTQIQNMKQTLLDLADRCYKGKRKIA